jgi:hypothetical protein
MYKLLALRGALKINRIPIARDILMDIYVRVDLLDECEWGCSLILCS